MQNDIKIGVIPWDFKVENQCFNFCVGENVGWSFKWKITSDFDPTVIVAWDIIVTISEHI